MVALTAMSGTVAAICFLISLVAFVVAAVIAYPANRWATVIAVGLSSWVFVLLWAALVRA